MSTEIDAVYEDGVFKPLKPVRELATGCRVRITVEQLSDREIEAMLDGAFATYDGLSEEEIKAVESSRLDGEHFFRQR